jgi:hypothetical protein
MLHTLYFMCVQTYVYDWRCSVRIWLILVYKGQVEVSSIALHFSVEQPNAVARQRRLAVDKKDSSLGSNHTIPQPLLNFSRALKNVPLLSNTSRTRHLTYNNRKKTQNNTHFDSICLLPSSPTGTSTPSVWVPMELRRRQRQMLRAWSIIVRYCSRSLTRESTSSFSFALELFSLEAIG